MKKTEYGNTLETADFVKVDAAKIGEPSVVKECMRELDRIGQQPTFWMMYAAEWHLRGLSYKRIAEVFENVGGLDEQKVTGAGVGQSN